MAFHCLSVSVCMCERCACLSSVSPLCLHSLMCEISPAETSHDQESNGRTTSLSHTHTHGHTHAERCDDFMHAEGVHNTTLSTHTHTHSPTDTNRDVSGQQSSEVVSLCCWGWYVLYNPPYNVWKSVCDLICCLILSAHLAASHPDGPPSEQPGCDNRGQTVGSYNGKSILHVRLPSLESVSSSLSLELFLEAKVSLNHASELPLSKKETSCCFHNLTESTDWCFLMACVTLWFSS